MKLERRRERRTKKRREERQRRREEEKKKNRGAADDSSSSDGKGKKGGPADDSSSSDSSEVRKFSLLEKVKANDLKCKQTTLSLFSPRPSRNTALLNLSLILPCYCRRKRNSPKMAAIVHRQAGSN